MGTLSIQSLKTHFIPPKDPKIQTKALLVLVHGRTGNIKVLQWYAKRFDIPELAYLAVEAPFQEQREDQDEAGFSWYLKDRSGIDESRQKLRSMTDEFLSQGLLMGNIFWLGFSQGAAMILDLALRGSHKMGGFLCISGFCVQHESYPTAFNSVAKSQRILITHGSRDEIITLAQAEKSYEPLKDAGIPFGFRVYNKPHSFHLRDEVPFLEATLKDWIRR